MISGLNYHKQAWYIACEALFVQFVHELDKAMEKYSENSYSPFCHKPGPSKYRIETNQLLWKQEIVSLKFTFFVLLAQTRPRKKF